MSNIIPLNDKNFEEKVSRNPFWDNLTVRSFLTRVIEDIIISIFLGWIHLLVSTTEKLVDIAFSKYKIVKVSVLFIEKKVSLFEVSLYYLSNMS